MRKIFFTLGTVLWVSLVCFAGGVSASSGAGDSTAPAQVKSETFTGKVDAVVVRDSAEGKVRQITLRDSDGRQKSFTVAPDATVTGKDGNPTSLSWAKGNKASVTYVTAPNGYTQIVRSIQIL
ncbi:MAG: hypothetical protein V1673_03975 [Candidatus Omnitrophota bacterium]